MNVLLWCAARGIPLYGPSGASAHLRGIARALSRAGHRVQVRTPVAADDRGSWDADPPLAARHLPGGPWPVGLRTVGARIDGYRLLPTTRWDLVWERHEPASRAIGRWAAVTGVPRWVELNAPLTIERAWPRAPRASRVRRELEALRGADRILAVSRRLVQWALDHGVPADRIRYVPNGVEPQGPGDRERIRSSLGLVGPVVGYLGSAQQWHGTNRIPAIVDALPEAWTAVVVGGRAPTHPRLIGVGHIPSQEVPDYVSAFDVAIAPYVADGPWWFCPLKVLAYRAQGIPIVTSDIGDAAELAGVPGLTTDDPRVWAAAVLAAHETPRVPWTRTWDDVLADAF